MCGDQLIDIDASDTGKLIDVEVKDRWQHRSKGMRCRTCMWACWKKRPVGRCRRHAPTMNGYPVIFEDDWCGDHKLDENALVVS